MPLERNDPPSPSNATRFFFWCRSYFLVDAFNYPIDVHFLRHSSTFATKPVSLIVSKSGNGEH